MIFNFSFKPAGIKNIKKLKTIFSFNFKPAGIKAVLPVRKIN